SAPVVRAGLGVPVGPPRKLPGLSLEVLPRRARIPIPAVAVAAVIVAAIAAVRIVAAVLSRRYRRYAKHQKGERTDREQIPYPFHIYLRFHKDPQRLLALLDLPFGNSCATLECGWRPNDNRPVFSGLRPDKKQKSGASVRRTASVAPKRRAYV